MSDGRGSIFACSTKLRAMLLVGRIFFFFGKALPGFLMPVKWLWKDSLKNIPSIQPKSHLSPTSPDTAINYSSARDWAPWHRVQSFLNTLYFLKYGGSNEINKRFAKYAFVHQKYTKQDCQKLNTLTQSSSLFLAIPISPSQNFVKYSL